MSLGPVTWYEPCAVAVSDRQEKTREEVSVAACAAFVAFEGLRLRRQFFQQDLDAGIAPSDFSHFFKAFVFSVNTKLHIKGVVAQVADTLYLRPTCS